MSHATPVVYVEPAGWEDRASTYAGAFIAGYKSSDTRHAYKHDMRRWFEFCAAHTIDPFEARRTHVELYMRRLEADGLANATIGRRVSTVGAWYEWLVHEQVLEHSPVSHVRRPKKPNESTRNWLTRTELADFLNAAEELGGYDYATACLLALNGLRIGEICRANVDDLGTAQWHHTLAIIGKGDEHDTVPLSPRCRQAIEQAVGRRELGPLILTQADTRMNRGAGARIVQRVAKRAGISKHLSPHCLRHSAITALLSAGVPLRDVQIFARHADPKTTVRYDRARKSLDRSPVYQLAQYITGAT